MKSILGVSLLILLMPSAYAAALPGPTAPKGSACMTPTAWDATTLASIPARTDSFITSDAEKQLGGAVSPMDA